MCQEKKKKIPLRSKLDCLLHVVVVDVVGDDYEAAEEPTKHDGSKWGMNLRWVWVI